MRDNDGGGAEDGVLAALPAFSHSLGGENSDNGNNGGGVDDGAR